MPPELEHKKTKDKDGKGIAKEEVIRHWTDKEIKELHKVNGKSWRSNNDNLRVVKTTRKYLDNYDGIFRKK